MSKTPIRVDVWSDIACPWCWLGKHRFEAALADYGKSPDSLPVELTFHSYQLSPDMPEDFSQGHDAYMAERLGWTPEQVAASGRQLQALGDAHGLTYDFAKNQKANTRKAHELLHHAKAAGRQAEVNERLFQAYFRDGQHIGRIDTLADIAEAAGLDRAETVQVLESGAYGAAVEADQALAARLGVRGVPFFVLDGKQGLAGAREPAEFLAALRQTAETR